MLDVPAALAWAGEAVGLAGHGARAAPGRDDVADARTAPRRRLGVGAPADDQRAVAHPRCGAHDARARGPALPRRDGRAGPVEHRPRRGRRRLRGGGTPDVARARSARSHLATARPWPPPWPRSTGSARPSRSATTSRGRGRRSGSCRPGRSTPGRGAGPSRCSPVRRRRTSRPSCTATTATATCCGTATRSAGSSTGWRPRPARRGWTRPTPRRPSPCWSPRNRPWPSSSTTPRWQPNRCTPTGW